MYVIAKVINIANEPKVKNLNNWKSSSALYLILLDRFYSLLENAIIANIKYITQQTIIVHHCHVKGLDRFESPNNAIARPNRLDPFINGLVISFINISPTFFPKKGQKYSMPRRGIILFCPLFSKHLNRKGQIYALL